MNREFFKDGVYSLLRFMGGSLCALMPSLFIPLCVGYVIIDDSNSNVSNDLREMLVGYFVTNLLISIIYIKLCANWHQT